MLPAAARVHTRREHRLVAQAGARARRGCVVVTAAHSDETPDRARAAVVAGRRVGPAVVRNRVKRRLRAIVRQELPGLPGGTLLVVRALPGAADASFDQLGRWVRSGVAGSVPVMSRE